MHGAQTGDPRESCGEDMFWTARMNEGADVGRNDRQTRVIWATGFFDGEGSIGIYPTRRGTSYQLVVAVGQVDVRPLMVFKELWDGNIYSYTQKRFPINQWRTSNRKAMAVLVEMLPWLCNKREQAEVAINFQSELVAAPGNRPGSSGWGMQPLPAETLSAQREAAERLKQLKRPLG